MSIKKEISKVKNMYCGFNMTAKQGKRLNKLAMIEFKKPKHLRTTPYLLLKKVINYDI